MRLCIITPLIGRNDGQGRVNLEIAAEAARQGHEVTVMAEQVSGLPLDVRVRAITLPPPSWLPTRLLRDQLFALRTRAVLVRTRGDYDAVIGNGFVTWARCDLNAVHFVHSSWLRSAQHPWRLRRTPRSFYAWVYSACNVALERLALRRSARIVAVSASVARDLRRNKVQPTRISVVLNGVDTAEFHPGPKQRVALGLPVDVKLALFAGDLKSPRKNLETVLRALADAPGLHLAVAGRKENTPYPALAKRLGIYDRVHFLGFRHDMPALMRSSDMFVFPSRYEACSLVLIEALASGTPVITARSAGGSELIGRQVGVVLEHSDDAAALADTLRTLMADESRRSAMARSARVLAQAHSWKSMACIYVELLLRATADARDVAHA